MNLKINPKLQENAEAYIKAIEYGLINDDFMHNRFTAKCYIEYPDHYIPCKVYKTGLITAFTDDRIVGGEYVEREVDDVLKSEIQDFLKAYPVEF